MDEPAARALAIALLVFLALLFVISFVWYMRTKPPKGCERTRKEESDCIGCKNAGCRLYRPRAEKEIPPEEGKKE